MTAEEFERRYGFRPSQFVLDNMNRESNCGEAKIWIWDELFNAQGGDTKPSYHCIVSRSGKDIIYEFCNKKLKDDISAQTFIFDIDGQLIYIDMEE